MVISLLISFFAKSPRVSWFQCAIQCWPISMPLYDVIVPQRVHCSKCIYSIENLLIKNIAMSMKFFAPRTSPMMTSSTGYISALLAICAGNSPVRGEFPAQRPVMRNVDVFVNLRPNKLLSKQSWSWWFEMPSRPLWRHRNDNPLSGYFI